MLEGRGRDGCWSPGRSVWARRGQGAESSNLSRSTEVGIVGMVKELLSPEAALECGLCESGRSLDREAGTRLTKGFAHYIKKYTLYEEIGKSIGNCSRKMTG